MTTASKGAPGAFKQAIATGQAMAKADTAEATIEYFKRQIGAAQADTNTAAVAELAAQGADKFPKEMTFQLLVAQAQLKQGKFQEALGAARRVLDIDPKNTAAAQYVMFALNQLGQTDSILGSAQKMIAGGIPKDSLARSLVTSIISPALDKAQKTKERADWEATLTAAESVDAIAPSAQSAFYIGVSSLQVAADILPHVQTLSASAKPADRAQGCAETKQAEDLLTKTSIAMPRGASVDKNTAAQILTSVGSFGEFITQAKKTLCK